MEHRLKKLEQDVAALKKKKVDKDSVMTEEDYQALLAFRKEKTKGTLTSHEELQKELELH